ncbi:hypothetical protein SLT36_19280 [Aminobacter sp. BA135]|uniref:2-amino-5-chloromuconate deaminase CnbZ n=1 Tax=Aminobacter sp. BA135 TaxID=537596 RepID=UPI003D79A85C
MGEVIEFASGGYRFIKGVSQYSGGVSALPGFRLERVRFAHPLPLAEGFAQIEKIITAAGRPLAAFAACELRSPAPFSEEGFVAFNSRYTQTLKAWGLLETGNNPVARSNVCPQIAPPQVPSIYAFSFTVPTTDATPSFVISGSAEVPEGHAAYRDHIVSRGDLSPEGLRTKAQFVLEEMERRASTLGFGWENATAVQVYTVHNLYPFLADEIVKRGAARAGLTWHYNNPPVVDLEYEMDLRGVAAEHVV